MITDYWYRPKLNYNIHRSLLKEALIKYFFFFRGYVIYLFSLTNIFNFFLLIFLSNIFYSISFYSITILILCTIFLLFYFHLLNSSIEPIEKSIDQIYLRISSLISSYIVLLKKNRKILLQLSNLPELSSSIFNTDQHLNVLVANTVFSNKLSRDFSLVDNYSYLLPLIHCIELKLKIIENEKKMLFLIKQNLVLRKKLSVKIVNNFKKSLSKLSALDLKNQYLIFILFLYIKIILDK